MAYVTLNISPEFESCGPPLIDAVADRVPVEPPSVLTEVIKKPFTVTVAFMGIEATLLVFEIDWLLAAPGVQVALAPFDVATLSVQPV